MTHDKNIRVRPIPTEKRGSSLKIQTSRILHHHELVTLMKLIKFGYDIFCQTEKNLPYTKVADILWQNEQWEIKSITGSTRHTIKNSLRKAKQQSANIIIDISTCRLKINSVINHVQDHMRDSKKIKKVIIIQNNNYCIVTRNTLI